MQATTLKSRKINIISSTLIFIIVACFFSGGSIFVNAQNKDSFSIDKTNKALVSKVLDDVNKKSPQNSKKIKTERKNKEIVISDQIDIKVNTDLKNKKIKLTNKNKGEINLGIPNSNKLNSVDVLDDKILYSDKDSLIDVVVEPVEGGIRQIINIKSDQSPNFYDFPVELSKGDNIKLLDS